MVILTILFLLQISRVPVIRAVTPTKRIEPAIKKDKICILIPVTSRKQNWKKIEDTFVYRMPLSSLAKTCEPSKFSYTIFIGYDTGDTFFDNQHTLSALKQFATKNIPFAVLKTKAFTNDIQKPGPMMNFLSREAYEDNCDFMYRINDDTEFLNPWTSAFVNTLRSFHPPLQGVVGPTCHEGNTAILTHDFVHRSHLDIFKTHYPPELTDWWLDDWITFVYGDSNTKKLKEVVVRHHVLDTRYEVRWESEKIYKSLIEQGKLVLASAAQLPSNGSNTTDDPGRSSTPNNPPTHLCIHGPLYGQFNNQLLTVSWANMLARQTQPNMTLLLTHQNSPSGSDYLAQNWGAVFGEVPGIVWMDTSSLQHTTCKEMFSWEEMFADMTRRRSSVSTQAWPLLLPVSRVREEANKRWIELREQHGLLTTTSLHGRSFEGLSDHCSGSAHAAYSCRHDYACDYSKASILSRFSSFIPQPESIVLFSDGQNQDYAQTYLLTETREPLEVQMWMMATSDLHIGHPGSSQDYVVWRWRQELQPKSVMLPPECYHPSSAQPVPVIAIDGHQNSLESMLIEIPDPVFVTYGNKGYQTMMSNFVCNMALFPGMHSHILIIVTDAEMATFLKTLSPLIHVYYVAKPGDDMNEAYDFATPNYLQLMMSRGVILLDILTLSQTQMKSVVWLEPDFLYYQNLLDRPEMTETTSDLVFYWDHVAYCGCFIRFAPVPASFMLYKEVMDRMHTIHAEGGSKNDQVLLNEVVTERRPNMSVFDACLYRAGAHAGWESKYEQECRGIRPVAQHHNWIVGVKTKEQAAKDMKGWFLTDTEQGHCQTRDMLLVVMTMNRPWALQRLIRSLSTAAYAPGARIDLRITVDRNFQNEVHADTASLLDSLQWEHGILDIHVWPHKMGLFGQWVDSWPAELYPASLYKAVVLLEDDLEASPHYAEWFIGAHKAYDHIEGVGAITGQRPNLVAAINGPSSVAGQVPPGVKAFGYLLMATWSLSPTHRVWCEFRRWVKDKRLHDPGFVPSVPGIVPNTWYEHFMTTGEEGNMWEMWYIRFVHERGLHTVYAWVEGGNKAIMGNWMEAGLHFSGKPVLDFPLATEWDPGLLQQSPLPMVGYDLAFT